MKTRLSQLAGWAKNSVLVKDGSFDGVSTDSRQVMPGNLFIALNGENFDAHRFLSDVATRGAGAVLVERVPEQFEVPALVVKDTRLAMGEIATHWRREFSVPVVGVSGSNGKTTVKEMVASILHAAFGDGGYLSTSGNFNNDIGVPLTVFRMDAKHQAAVIELGMNHVGEMAYLTAIAQPTVGLVNNAQREHQEFMQSVEAVAKENGTIIQMLPEDGVAVFPADDTYTPLWKSYAAGRRTITFGFGSQADVTAQYRMEKAGTHVVMTLCGQKLEMTLKTSGVHNVRNAMAAAACAHGAGIDSRAIVAGLESFSPVHGRLERKIAFNGAILVDDTYNANPDSVRAAIDVLADMTEDSVLVLGDMGEVGSHAEQYHTEVGAYARERGIRHFFTLGDLAGFASRGYGQNARHFTELDEMNKALKELVDPAMTVLVKGSRFMRMERVVERLMNEM